MVALSCLSLYSSCSRYKSKTASSSILSSPDTMRKICNQAPPVALRDGWH